MPKMKFMYDSETDSLAVYREGRAHSSVDLGEIIISFDKGYNVVGMEILNPDKVFRLFGVRISKKKLSEIKRASLSVQYRGNLILIMIALKFEDEVERIPISLPLAQPLPA